MRVKFSKNLVGKLLIILGGIIVFASVFLDYIRFDGSPNGFGWKQFILLVFGFSLIVPGVILGYGRTVYTSIRNILIDQKYLLVLIAVIISFLWFFWIYRAGVEFSADSSQYLSFALKMRYTGDFRVNPVWPPLYPFLVSLFMLGGIFPGDSAALISGLSFTLTLIPFSLILRKFSGNLFFSIGVLFILFTMSPFLYVFRYAWSEGPFIMFSVWAFYFSLKHYQEKRFYFYLFASVFIALSSLTRYIGIAWILVFILYTIWFLIKSNSSQKNLFRYLLTSGISFIPLTILIVRNFIETGFFFGPRKDPLITGFHNLNLTRYVLSKDINLVLGLLILVSLVLIILYLQRKQSLGLSAGTFFFVIILVTVYLTFMIYSSTIAAINPIDTRLLAPTYPFIVLIIAIGYYVTYSTLEQRDQNNISVSMIYNVFYYSFLFAAIFVNINPFATFMNSIYMNKFEEITSHFSAGYNLSPSSEENSNYILDALGEQDHVFFTAVVDYYQPPRPTMSSSFFYRGVLFKDKQYNNIAFRNVTGIQGSNLLNFDIDLKLNDIPKIISYRSTLSTDKINSDLFEDLRNIMKSNQIDSIYLITYQAGDIVVGRDLDKDIPSDFKITKVDKLGYYTFYKLVYVPIKL